MKNNIYIILIISCLISGCRSDGVSSFIEKDQNSIKILKAGTDSVLLEVSLSQSGEIDYVSNKVDKGYQTIYYNHESGYIIAKLLKTASKKQDGLVYYFSNDDEEMRGVQRYINDKAHGDGFLFYDGMNRVEKFVRYDSLNGLVFERNYSVDGKVVK
jgi:hypothetical protein